MVSTLSEMDKNKNYLVVLRPGRFNVQVEELEQVPNLEKLKTPLDGGLIEVVPFFNKFMGRDCLAFCDEEGKNKGLIPNQIAQTFWEKVTSVAHNDYLVGPIVIVVGSKDFLAQL
jgi:hypothetical protein